MDTWPGEQPRELPAPAAVRRAVVVSSRFKPEAHPLAADIAARLQARGIATSLHPEGGPAAREAAAAADLVIAVGGDGTILGTARLLAGLLVPTIGVNLGKLGFLAEFDLDDIRAWLEGELARFRLVPRLMLECRCGQGPPTYALNDAVITQGPMARLLSIEMDVGGERATRYNADGVVVSTPVGSTAYSLSLGGPLLVPGANALIVTPIAPHSLTNRPLVLEGSSELTFRVRRAAPALSLVVDGQESCALDVATPVGVRRAPRPFLLAAHSQRSFFEVLRCKLHWTRAPGYHVPLGLGLPPADEEELRARLPAVVYLHGLLSGPRSHKGRYLAERLRARGVVVELAELYGEQGLAGATVGEALARAAAAVERVRRLAGLGAQGPVVLVGSSFGGWLAALLAARDPGIAALVLLAPAFDFVRRLEQWLPAAERARAAQTGWIELPHPGPEGGPLRIGVRLLEEGGAYPGYPEVHCPAVVIHGRHDDLVPLATVERFAAGRRHVRLVVVEDDHRLGGVLDLVAAELDVLLARLAEPGCAPTC